MLLKDFAKFLEGGCKVNSSAEVFLSTSPMFNSKLLWPDAGGSLSPDDLAFIKKIGKVRHYKKGSLTLSMGSSVKEFFLVRKGVARITLLGRNGVEKPVLYIGPGCFFGEEGIFHSQPVIYNAVAIKDMEVLAIERQSSWDVISRPSLAQVLIKSVSLKSRILAHQVEDFAFRNTVEKVCRLLYCLLTDPESNFYNNRMKLTHKELADMAGVHRVTITNTISHLRGDGIIRILSSGEIVVEDRDRLRILGFGE